MFNESKVFLLLSLQCGWSPVNIGRKITLEDQKKHRHPWLLCIMSMKNSSHFQNDPGLWSSIYHIREDTVKKAAHIGQHTASVPLTSVTNQV